MIETFIRCLAIRDWIIVHNENYLALPKLTIFTNDPIVYPTKPITYGYVEILGKAHHIEQVELVLVSGCVGYEEELHSLEPIAERHFMVFVHCSGTMFL